MDHTEKEAVKELSKKCLSQCRYYCRLQISNQLEENGQCTVESSHSPSGERAQAPHRFILHTSGGLKAFSQATHLQKEKIKAR